MLIELDPDSDTDTDSVSGEGVAPHAGLEPDPDDASGYTSARADEEGANDWFEAGADDGADDGFEARDDPAVDESADGGADGTAAPAYSTALELRVLRGPQAGSRLELAVAEYVLGASDQCAIILAGPHVEDEHALLRFDGRCARIQPLNGSLADTRGGQIAAEMELVPGKQIVLGGIWIAVDHPEAGWPDPQTVGADPGETAPAVPGPARPEEPVPAGSEAAPAAPPPRKTALAIAALLAATVAAGAIAALAWPGPDRPLAAAHGPDTHAAVVRPDLAAPPKAVTDFLGAFDGGARLAVRRDEDGGWVVDGYVKSRAARQALADGLADIGHPVGMRVTVEEDLVDAATRWLAQRPGTGALKVENAGAGALRLTGSLADEQSLQALTKDLLDKVEGVREIRPEVLFAGQLREQLMARIADAGLGKVLTVASEGPELVLTGKLTAEQTAAWERLLVEFTRQHGAALAIRASITRQVLKLPVGVQVVVSGPIPYIITSRGERVNQGSSINGVTLVSVKDGEVVFEGNHRYRLAR